MDRQIKINNDSLIGLAVLFYYAAIRLTDLGSFKNFGYYVSLLLLMGVSVLVYRDRLRIRFTRYHVYILLFALYTYLTSFWAARASLTIPKFNRLIFILGEMTLIAIADGGKRNVGLLLKSVMYGGYAIVFFILFRYGWRSIIAMLAESKRIDNEVLNANYLGMAAAYSVIINFYEILHVKKKITFMDLLAVPTVAVLIASGSRKAIVALAMGFAGLYLLKKWDDRNSIRSFLKLLLLVPLLAVVLYLVSRLPVFSGINTRMADLFKALTGEVTRKNSAWLRLQYNQLGMELFRSAPLRGVGIGNSNYYTLPLYGHDHYLHNNFVELLACGGLIGFTLYYSMHASILLSMFRYRKHRDGQFDICLVLLVVWIIMDYGCVRYFNRENYLLLMIFWFEAQNLREADRRLGGPRLPDLPHPAAAAAGAAS